MGRPIAERLPDRWLVPLLNVQADRAPTFSGPDDGSRIDILVGYSTEAEAWVGGREKMEMEIAALVVKANAAYEKSEITPRLNLVGTQRVNHPVVDPDELAGDAFMLRDGAGDLGQLHTLRDQLRADLVSLLVLNAGDQPGDDGCGKNAGGRACGYGFTQRDFPGPGDQPGTPAWEGKFANDGFSVAHVKAAVNAYTFHHEVSHNLGAHHDFYAFFKNMTDPTADRFARGWIAYGQKIRTVMAYNALCELAGTSCSIFNRFSNPNHSAGAGEPDAADPRPAHCNPLTLGRSLVLTNIGHDKHRRRAPRGESRLGERSWTKPVSRARYQRFSIPAQLRIVRAINRMAWTVAHYRLSNAP